MQLRDRLLGFGQRRRHLVVLTWPAHEPAQALLHLRHGVVLEDVDGDPARLRFADLDRAAAERRPQRHDRVGVVKPVRHRGRRARLRDRLLQPRAGDAQRQQATMRSDRAWCQLEVELFLRLRPRRLEGQRCADGVLLLDLDLAAGAQLTAGRDDTVSPQQGIDRVRHIVMNRNPRERLDLHQDAECRRGLAFQDRLSRAAPPRLLVGEGHSLNTADQVGQGGVHHQVGERVAVRRRDQLDPTLGDRAGRLCLQLRADLVDHDDLRHMVLHRLHHDAVLEAGGGHLHATRAPDAGVGNVTVSRDLVRGVHYDHAPPRFREHPRDFAQHGRFSHAWAAQQEDAATRMHEIIDHLHRPIDGPSHSHRQPHYVAVAVADTRDAMQRAVDSGAVVVAELAQLRNHCVQHRLLDRCLAQLDLIVDVARPRRAAQVEHDLQQRTAAVGPGIGGDTHRVTQRLGQRAHQGIEVVGHALKRIGWCLRRRVTDRGGLRLARVEQSLWISPLENLLRLHGVVVGFVAHRVPTVLPRDCWMRVTTGPPAVPTPRRLARQA